MADLSVLSNSNQIGGISHYYQADNVVSGDKAREPAQKLFEKTPDAPLEKLAPTSSDDTLNRASRFGSNPANLAQKDLLKDILIQLDKDNDIATALSNAALISPVTVNGVIDHLETSLFKDGMHPDTYGDLVQTAYLGAISGASDETLANIVNDLGEIGFENNLDLQAKALSNAAEVSPDEVLRIAKAFGMPVYDLSKDAVSAYSSAVKDLAYSLLDNPKEIVALRDEVFISGVFHTDGQLEQYTGLNAKIGQAIAYAANDGGSGVEFAGRALDYAANNYPEFINEVVTYLDSNLGIKGEVLQGAFAYASAMNVFDRDSLIALDGGAIDTLSRGAYEALNFDAQLVADARDLVSKIDFSLAFREIDEAKAHYQALSNLVNQEGDWVLPHNRTLKQIASTIELSTNSVAISK
jgi:hypothetical protein